MPALIHFNRKWLIACDDFVIPFAIEAFSRLIWLIYSVLMMWQKISGCSNQALYIKYYFYAFAGEHLLTMGLCISICVISSRGTVLQVDQRIHLPKLLYVKCATVLLDCALLSSGAWILSNELNLCSQMKIFIEGAVVSISLFLFAFLIGTFVCYNFMGSSVFWNPENKANSIKIFKKAEKVWRLRLKFFCCCADVSEDENDFIYVEISTFLATFLNDVDLAPTDILAGLISLSKIHTIEKRKIKWPCETDSLLVDKPKPTWMTAENALHYLRVAKSTYGWVAFFNPLYPWKLCALLSPFRCCQAIFHKTTTKQGDPFYCETSALEKISGLPNSDILFASFSNSIYETAFIVAFDHSKKAVIIAIRGTRSVSDLVTVVDGDETTFPVDVSKIKIKCHRGALRSALFIKKKIDELKVLEAAFAENPSFTLVITGHSLGASIASILGLLLYPKYPSLQCYSYAPLPVLSARGMEKTFDFVFSIVVGDDTVPRLSVHSCMELKKQIHAALEKIKLPKYKLLTKSVLHYISKSLKLPHKILSTSEVYDNTQVEVKDEASIKEVQIDMTPKETQLYAPGRILYIREANGYDFSWVTGTYFQNIIISPFIIRDHQPHQIQVLLEKYADSKKHAMSAPLLQATSNVEIVKR